jgi:hypothetical protein
MIGNVNALGKGFKGVASYLESGKDGQQLDRVDWMETRNLPTHDPQSAACIMAATARDSEKTERAVYHFSISFDPGDAVDREAMRRVADRTLRDLGLQDHQALIVAHRDTAHPHVHVMVNRVNPETGRAWSNFRDYPRIEKSLRAQEVEMGLRVVPGKHARVPEQSREHARPAPERAARGDAAWVERARAQAGPHLQGARSWAELERGLAEHGLSLRVKGRGMVVTDGRQEVKASDLFREASRYRLEKRLGSLADHRAREAVASHSPKSHMPASAAERPGPDSGRNAAPAPRSPAVEGDRTLHEVAGLLRDAAAREQAEAAVAHLAQAAGRAKMDVALLEEKREYARSVFGEIRREAGAVYVHPDAALRAIDGYARQHGGREAARAVRQSPHHFGELRGVERSRYLGFVVETSYRGALEHVPELSSLVERAGHLRETRQRAGDVLRAQDKVREAGRRLDTTLGARAALSHVNVRANVRDAAARLAAVQLQRGVEAAANMAAQLAPMLPTSAAGLVKQAVQLGKDLAIGRDPERDRGHSR